MGSFLDRVPARIQEHIRGIMRAAGLPRTADAADAVAQCWLDRESRFEAIIRQMLMEEARLLQKSDARGCLVLTASGSLASIGPRRKTARTVQYASLELRTDVPQSLTHISSELSADVRVGAPIAFKSGPLANSSPVFRMALTAEEIDLEEQERSAARAAWSAARELIEANRQMDAGEE
jgi:hypothetical protein